MTIEEVNRTLDVMAEVWKGLTESINEIAENLTRLFEQLFDITPILLNAKGLPNSPKHRGAFPAMKRRVRTDIFCNYKANLKPMRNLPYQRRNY